MIIAANARGMTMKLLEMLQEQAEVEESYFRKALLREDIGRVETMMEKAQSASTEAAYMKDALYIGWTQGDLRTVELKETLQPLMQAVFARMQEGESPKADDRVLARWHEFAKQRMKVLIHCL